MNKTTKTVITLLVVLLPWFLIVSEDFKHKSLSSPKQAFVVNQQDYDMLVLRVNQLDNELNKLKFDFSTDFTNQSDINNQIILTLQNQSELNQTLLNNFTVFLTK